MRIVITGSPGTGKTRIAKALAKAMGLELIDIKRIVEQAGLDKGPEHEVDIKALSEALSFLKGKDDYVVEGHLACELRLPADHIIVLRTNPAVLRKRLAKRRYPKEKLEGNLMAEMLDYCTQRAEKEYRLMPLELDTSQLTPPQAIARIEAAIKHKKKKLDTVNYSKELEEHLTPSRFR
jgi:adenylate kinase